jgi:hypothetical protein
LSLLKKIQNAAVESGSDLGEILRRCKVLAAHLGSKPLEDWLLWESNGYPENQAVPTYRRWEIGLRGHFSGPFGSGTTNLPIPAFCIPDKIRESVVIHQCRHSIAALEKSVVSADHDTIISFSYPEVAFILGTTVVQGQNCVQLLGDFSTSHYVEVLNAVRNRVLDFALQLEKLDPQAGEVVWDVNAAKSGEVTQIINAVMYGGTFGMGDTYKVGQAGAVGPRSKAMSNTFQQIWNENSGNLDLNELTTELGTLRKALSEKATEADHYVALGNVAAAEHAAKSGDGPKALQYLRNAGAWALDTAKDIAAKIAVEAITASMRQ